MADSIDFDFSEVNKLAADLGRPEASLLPGIRKAVQVAAMNVKQDWQAAAAKANPSHAKRYPQSIDFDMLNRIGEVAAEIGPNLGKTQGPLGILEDAPGGVASAPQRNYEKALRNNLADFERGLLKAVGEWFA